MNTPQTHTPDHGHASAQQALFPGGVAALDAPNVRALLSDYVESRARYSGPLEAPTARAGAMAGGGMVPDYEVRPGGVARIEISGLMLQRPGFLARLFLGAVDTVQLAAAVEEAGRDASVRSLLVVINSPGGAVHGTAELAAAVAEVARTKPVVALTDGSACSAAYWVASSCSSVYGSSANVMAGSIGVVSVHAYTPSAAGTVVTEIKSGKYKTVGSFSKPLTGDDLAHMQEKIDYLATQFINAVAKGRNLSPAAVAAQEARVYIGQQAVDAGLLDGFMSVGELERQLAADPGRFMRRGVVRPSVSAAPAAVRPAVAALPQVRPPKSEEDVRAEAAGEWIAALKDGRWSSMKPPRVMSWIHWEAVGAARAKTDGITPIEGMKREGFIHSYINLKDPGQLGTPGAKSTMKLSPAEQGARARAWSQIKGCTVVDALKQMGFPR